MQHQPRLALAVYLLLALIVPGAFHAPLVAADHAGIASTANPFADDELVFVSDAVPSADYTIQLFAPDAQYHLQPGPIADPLAAPPSATLPDPAGGYQHQFNLATGRPVNPNRDVVLALTKLGFDSTSSSLRWQLQEISFGRNHPSTPPTVPPLEVTAPVMSTQPMAPTSPGALAVADLDLAADVDGRKHDEAVLAYELSSNGSSQVQLSVVSYGVVPGSARITASIGAIAAGQVFAYPCNISFLYAADLSDDVPCPQRYPGSIEIAVGDLDGDGFPEITLLTLAYDASLLSNTLNAYSYSYCPPVSLLSPGDQRRGLCSDPDNFALVFRGMATLSSGLDVPPGTGTPGLGSFQNPAELTAGDFDGDGSDELAAVYLVNQRWEEDLEFDDHYLGDATLSVLKLNGTGIVRTLDVVSSTALATVDAWYDGGAASGGPPMHYHDLRIVAGVFWYRPDLGFGAARRQIAVAYSNAKDRLKLDVWWASSPGSPPPLTPPTTWQLGRYGFTELDYCGDRYAAFGLAAGNWAANRQSSPSPLQGVAVSVEQARELQLSLYRVDPDSNPNYIGGTLTRTSQQPLAKQGDRRASCGAGGSRNELAALDFEGDGRQLAQPERPHRFWIGGVSASQ